MNAPNRNRREREREKCRNQTDSWYPNIIDAREQRKVGSDTDISQPHNEKKVGR